MKHLFAIALLMLSLGSVALADGPDLPPSKSKVQLQRTMDGPDLPPIKHVR